MERINKLEYYLIFPPIVPAKYSSLKLATYLMENGRNRCTQFSGELNLSDKADNI
jgi:hypothetical protein